jgi:hypothetical protein
MQPTRIVNTWTQILQLFGEVILDGMVHLRAKSIQVRRSSQWSAASIAGITRSVRRIPDEGEVLEVFSLFDE